MTQKLISFKKEKLPLITLAIYVLGFIYYVIYYLGFDVDIVFYISLTDILLSILSSTLIFLLIVFIIELPLAFIVNLCIGIPSNKIHNGKRFCELPEDEQKRLDDQHDKREFKIRTIIYVIITVLLLFSNIGLTILSLFAFLMCLNFYSLARAEKKRVKRKKYFFWIVLVMLVFTFFHAISSSIRVKENMRHFYAKSIKFTVNGKQYSTMKNDTDRYNFIGETSSHLFVYDLKNKGTLVFAKSDVKNIEVYKRDLYFSLF